MSEELSEDKYINVWGARVHNLKNVDVSIPRRQPDGYYRVVWFW